MDAITVMPDYNNDAIEIEFGERINQWKLELKGLSKKNRFIVYERDREYILNLPEKLQTIAFIFFSNMVTDSNVDDTLEILDYSGVNSTAALSYYGVDPKEISQVLIGYISNIRKEYPRDMNEMNIHRQCERILSKYCYFGSVSNEDLEVLFRNGIIENVDNPNIFFIIEAFKFYTIQDYNRMHDTEGLVGNNLDIRKIFRRAQDSYSILN